MARTPTKENKPARKEVDDKSAGELPKHGDTYRCGGCGMEMDVTADCNCENPEHVKLECCGQKLTRV